MTLVDEIAAGKGRGESLSLFAVNDCLLWPARHVSFSRPCRALWSQLSIFARARVVIDDDPLRGRARQVQEKFSLLNPVNPDKPPPYAFGVANDDVNSAQAAAFPDASSMSTSSGGHKQSPGRRVRRPAPVLAANSKREGAVSPFQDRYYFLRARGRRASHEAQPHGLRHTVHDAFAPLLPALLRNAPFRPRSVPTAEHGNHRGARDLHTASPPNSARRAKLPVRARSNAVIGPPGCDIRRGPGGERTTRQKVTASYAAGIIVGPEYKTARADGRMAPRALLDSRGFAAPAATRTCTPNSSLSSR
ncbi:hypothetical protein BD413DRAFT_231439 [Trametes elegans]|nr:hypothetical protein BD413DRAFT_231439 [Trametes elegans]